MTERSLLIERSVRAVVGVVLLAITLTALILLSVFPVQGVTRDPLAVSVDVEQFNAETAVCGGAFMELGANPAAPEEVTSVGEVLTEASISADDGTELTRDGSSPPVAYRAEPGEALFAAQSVTIANDRLRGVSAGTCTTPRTEQWLVGGATTLGITTTLDLANPGEVPATVQITVFDEDGEVPAVETAGVIVAPGDTQTVSLNGYAPERERIAVRVLSTGSPVSARLGVAQVRDITPFAVSGTTAQARPETRLVIGGVANVNPVIEGPKDGDEGDPFPVVINALAPGEEVANVSAIALDEEGEATPVGEVTLEPGVLGQISVPVWPSDAHAVMLESSAPIVAGVRANVTEGELHDNEWLAPSSIVSAATPATATVVSGGRLVLMNPGNEAISVTMASPAARGEEESDENDPVTIELPPRSAVIRVVSGEVELTSTGEFAAAVRILAGANFAGYPVLVPEQGDGALTVYPR